MRWLVIGIGNELRRDDGLGPWIVEHVAGWNLPHVTTMCVHQLTPELSTNLTDCDRVLFVDASRIDGDVTPMALVPCSGSSRLGHAMRPGELLALASQFGGAPPAWLIAAPGQDFGFGEELSPPAIETGQRALASIAELIRSSSPGPKSPAPLPVQ